MSKGNLGIDAIPYNQHNIVGRPHNVSHTHNFNNRPESKRPHIVVRLPNNGSYEIEINYKRNPNDPPQLELPLTYWSVKRAHSNANNTAVDEPTTQYTIDDLLQLKLPFPSADDKSIDYDILNRLLRVYEKFGGDPKRLPNGIKQAI